MQPKSRSQRLLRSVGFFFVVALLLLLVGCGGGGGSGSGTPQQPPRSAVTIVVQDAFTRAGLANASVRLGQQNLTTNTNGIATVSNLPAGVYDLQISKSGYTTFATRIACFNGARYTVRFTPTLTPATDETFHQRSVQVFAAAEGLQEAIAKVQAANENTTEDPVLLFVSASEAFFAAVDSVRNYAPRSFSVTSSRGRLDFLSTFFALTKVERGKQEIQDLRRRLLNGEPVPEIDAWLSQHPFQGARSVKELREMYPGAEGLMLHRLFIVYQQQAPDSGFNTAMDGAKDIWLSQFDQASDLLKNLLSWTIDKVWSGAGKLVVKTAEFASLVLENTKQIAWLYDKAKQQLILVKVTNDHSVTVPQTTVDIVVSNGSAHKPSVVTDYAIGASTQTLTLRPEPISIILPGTKVYKGTFSGSQPSADGGASWKVTTNLSFTLELRGEGTNTSPYTGTLRITGTHSVEVYHPKATDYPGFTASVNGAISVASLQNPPEAFYGEGDIGAAIVRVSGYPLGNTVTVTFSYYAKSPKASDLVYGPIVGDITLKLDYIK